MKLHLRNVISLLIIVGCITLCQSLPQRGGAKTKKKTTTTTTNTAKQSGTAPINEATSASKKNAFRIAEEKCNLYKEARFVNKTIEPLLPGEMTVTIRIDACVRIQPLVAGGNPAAPKEFPHMALIGYGSEHHLSWNCGGSLISERFVLSAAHCSKKERPSWVRLGDLDYTTDKDDAEPKNYKIIQEIAHPLYKPEMNYHDIILYKLHTEVVFSPYMRPICLPMSPKQSDAKKAIITGWGQTATDEISSEKLLKAEIGILSTKECSIKFPVSKELPKGFNSSIAICAGNLTAAVDTCNGDSGGPLQTQLPTKDDCMYMQLGITSFGSYDCANRAPAVYTNVVAYVEWIQSIVWP